MATKQKSKKQTKSKRTVGKKPIKKAAGKKPAKKKVAPKKKLAKKTASPKKAAVKPKTTFASRKKVLGAKSTDVPTKQIRGRSQSVDTVAFAPAGKAARSGGQSGDLEGLSDLAGADSESVEELLEEGNAFEAEVVKGVEDAPDADQGEVRTHEVPEDDVPEEYDEK
jgi:hypothetical protein